MPAVVDTEKCDGCGNCETNCPNESIKVVDGKAQVNEAECIDCNMCKDECPQGAVEMK